MWIGLLGVFLLGAFATLQAGFNRQIADSWGFVSATLWNNIVLFIVSLSIFLLVKFFPQGFPEILRNKEPFVNFQWWYILPGLFGFSLVFGLPFAVSKLGATKVFIFLVAGQILCSLVWDLYIEKIPVTYLRVIGVALTLIGAICVSV